MLVVEGILGLRACDLDVTEFCGRGLRPGLAAGEQ